MEDKKLQTKEILISGFALFAIFFGAGNLILPPMLGFEAGKNWLLASLAFNISDSLLIFIGILAMNRRNCNIQKFGEKVSKNFGLFLVGLVVSLVGPLLSVPRTGATTYEVGVQTYIPNFHPYLFAILFFLFVYFITIHEQKFIDWIGRFLTPILLLTLILVIVRGIMSPMGVGEREVQHQFSKGFLEGYHTMDALGPIFLSGIILEDFKKKGILGEKNLARAILGTGIIAFIGLVFTYSGLTFLGSQSNLYLKEGLSRPELLTEIFYKLLGPYGKLAIALSVSFACLTTAVGLISSFARNFAIITKEKVSYKQWVALSCIVSAVLSILGVDGILTISAPLLLCVYPIVVNLYLLNLLDDGSMHPFIYRWTIILSFLAAFCDALVALGLKEFFLVQGYLRLPLAETGLAWTYFMLIGFLLAKIHIFFQTTRRK